MPLSRAEHSEWDDTVLNRVVAFADMSKRRDLAPHQITALVDRIVDSLACGILGSAEPQVRQISDTLLGLGGAAQCALMGGGRTSVENAAYLNGLSIRYFDWNDTYIGKNGGHPSDLLSTALAVGELAGKSGLDVLRAFCAGQHFMLDLCDAADAYARGWDYTTYTGIAGTVVAGILLDLTSEQLSHAIAMTIVSGNMLIGRSGRISTWKGLAAPHAVRNAVFSALLARAGVTGPSPVFEGEYGFIRRVSGPLELELNISRDRTADTNLKRFPAVYHAQGAIEVALTLHERMFRSLEPPLALHEIDEVVVETYSFGVKWAGEGADKWRPTNRETADHSIPFLVGLVLSRGHLDGEELESSIDDQAVLALTQRVRIVADAGFSAQWPDRAPTRVTIHSARGRFSDEISAPFGHRTKPMPSAMIDAKFRDVATAAIGDKAADGWLQRLRGFAGLESVAHVLAP
jgi:2-methylcitrate dehydratase